MAALAEQKSSILIIADEYGLGYVFINKLLELGHEVIAVGRNKAKLDHFTVENPRLRTVLTNVDNENDRIALYQRVLADYPEVNVLVYDAGVHHFLPPLQDTTDKIWTNHMEEISSNLVAPMHLSELFMEHLASKSHAMIINVSSCFAFFPYSNFPMYCAAKCSNYDMILCVWT